MRAQTAIPAKPIRCNVLRPARSTRKSWSCSKKKINKAQKIKACVEVQSDTYRDNSKHSVDNSSSYGGIDGLSNSSCVKNTCGVIKDLRGETEEK